MLPKALGLLPADYSSSWDVTLDGVQDRCTRQESLSEIIALVGTANRPQYTFCYARAAQTDQHPQLQRGMIAAGGDGPKALVTLSVPTVS